jgi:hypothetical protein
VENVMNYRRPRPNVQSLDKTFIADLEECIEDILDRLDDLEGEVCALKEAKEEEAGK